MKHIIVGIDEAGRGPLAGPVIACALTVLNPKFEYRNSKQIPNYNALNSTKHVSDFVLRASNLRLRDSKLLSARQRELIYGELLGDHETVWGVGSVSEKTIDKINIFQATRLAMKKAVLSLERKLRKRTENQLVPKIRDRELTVPGKIIDSLIIDGNILLDLPISQKAIIRADATILQCMAAGIVAKITRDRLMLRLHKKYPLYGFDKHKGYGTRLHLQALERFGPCAIHRMSFAPCQSAIDKGI